MRAFDWPGNVRQLQNEIQRAVLMCEGNLIDLRDLSITAVAAKNKDNPDLTLMEAMERNAIIQMLKETDGNKLETAKRLGIGRQTLYNKIKDLRHQCLTALLSCVTIDKFRAAVINNMSKTSALCQVAAIFALHPAVAQTNFQITGLSSVGQITWSNAFPSGVCTVEMTAQFNSSNASWVIGQNFFTTNSVGQGAFTPSNAAQFFRLRAVEIYTNTPQAWTNLIDSYGILHTIAGNGDAGYSDPGVDGSNYWQTSYEGGYATNAALSRPHFAMADNASNIFIIEKDSDALLKVTPDGRIHTVAGTHAVGNGPDTSSIATNVAMNLPNGLCVGNDGTAYILDTGNGKVRRLATNGMMTTLFSDSSGISGGRGLLVNSNETLVYYASGADLRRWTPSGGTANLNTRFSDLGNIVLNGTNLIATDRGGNTVWVVNTNTGARTLLYGNGGTNLVVDGTLALTNSLYGVRGIWQPPIGGYFLVNDYSAQIVYVDITGVLHLLLNGQNDDHAGDGGWFYAPSKYFIGQGRSITMDTNGNLIIVENDTGYVRKIDFHRLTP